MDKEKLQKKQADKRQQIIDAASGLIVEQGIEKTSLTDIAKAAGMSKGSLYYYYATKDDLIFDITETHINQISKNLFDIIENNRPDANWEELLKILYERILQAETRGRLHLYLIQQSLNGNTELAERFRKKYREWNRLIREGFEQIEPANSGHTILSSLIIAALDGFLIQSLLGIETIDADQLVRHLMVKTEKPART
ncbi:MAG: TetR/AcrR family transcriptional regulator [Thermodesulfobacteriota bacterium]